MRARMCVQCEPSQYTRPQPGQAEKRVCRARTAGGTRCSAAARERTGVRGESEAPEDLDRLVLGRERMHEAALGDVPALEQFAVPGEHDALLAQGRGNERGVLDAIVVEGVEAGQAQKACEAAEMGVGDEAWGQ
jgi:hypothetical protein